HSPQEWGRMLGEAFSQMGQYTDSQPVPPMNQFMGQAAATGLAMVSYGAAKQRLIADGMDPAHVEQMPVGQGLCIDANREVRKLSDGVLKRMYVPYSTLRQQERFNVFQEHGVHGIDAASRGFGYIVGSLLLPAMENVRTAGVRIEWQRNAIMTVEAI